jgi:predicted nucleotidyltransferase component of viral defense system
LGFKGGTAAYLLYGLPRFSVDLDFDLLKAGSVNKLVDRFNSLFREYSIKDQCDKRMTLFYLLDYGVGQRNIKIEISKRQVPGRYQLMKILGIPVLALDKPSMFAAKLAAVTQRPRFASRDIFDINFFARNQWGINDELVMHYTGLTVVEQLRAVIEKIDQDKKINWLDGLGELVEPDKKQWVRDKLEEDTIQLLRSYQFALS